ncbi:MAG: ComF family protein [Eubacteriaceae bacterium]|nr:ComF family protein [Eubacteriaceae bacterium]
MKGLFSKAMEAVFPTNIYCVCCGSVIDSSRKYGICDNCIDKFHWVNMKTCEKCGKILETGYSHPLCSDCRMRDHSFDRGFTCAQYGLYERAVIMDMKYRDKSYICRKLGNIMAERISLEDISLDLVIPVPVHEKRLEERGYNQAELIGRPVAKRLALDLRADILERKTATAAMKDLGVWDRIDNMKEAFGIRKNMETAVSGKDILLIDDIYTTGATLDGCSRTLKNAGAGMVHVLTFAAGGNISAANTSI